MTIVIFAALWLALIALFLRGWHITRTPRMPAPKVKR